MSCDCMVGPCCLEYFVLPLLTRHPRCVTEEGGRYKAAVTQALESRTGVLFDLFYLLSICSCFPSR